MVNMLVISRHLITPSGPAITSAGLNPKPFLSVAKIITNPIVSCRDLCQDSRPDPAAFLNISQSAVSRLSLRGQKIEKENWFELIA